MGVYTSQGNPYPSHGIIPVPTDNTRPKNVPVPRKNTRPNSEITPIAQLSIWGDPYPPRSIWGEPYPPGKGALCGVVNFEPCEVVRVNVWESVPAFITRVIFNKPCYLL